MIQARTSLLTLCAPLWLVLAACDPAATGPADARPEPGVLEATRNGPADAPPGSCWGRTVASVVVETISEQVQIAPAKVNPDGSIATLPKYRTEQRQRIVTPRVDNWFETPCEEVLTEEFIASLQRALQARGFYSGAITGELDKTTRAAIQSFQRPQGPDSGVLALETARRLGLIAVDRDTST